jgi:hypothetical protein
VAQEDRNGREREVVEKGKGERGGKEEEMDEEQAETGKSQGTEGIETTPESG